MTRMTDSADLRRAAMRADAAGPSAGRTIAVGALYDAVERIEELERESIELTRTLTTSMEFNERAHVLLTSIAKVMADVSFDPDGMGVGLGKPFPGRHAEQQTE